MTTDDGGSTRGRTFLRSKELAIAGVLALVIVAAVATLPLLVDARPAYEIPVDYRTSEGDLQEPTGESWETVPAASVPLSSAGAAVPQAEDTTIEQMRVEVARTNDRLYVRLSWADATSDTSTDSLREFADAAALQFPVNESERPPIAMGSTSNRVTIWYWSGDGQSQSLLAGGAGTTTQVQDSAMTTTATHTDDRWNVVFSRPLASDRANATDIPTDQDMDVALAVWNGSNMERSGQKAASEWYYLALGPDTGGPPYEAILWTIAGLAIVFTTLVTVEGVRRTGSE
ncbi:ethylbenzene dehydrogenase-related protein [Halopenitus sp. H-Gu1]|uniref:ethylbenzene dehydrogenase-related protein n=1 Tax=Halopenitus sp. H-Gu1 TaxID=3242697 RepID=UPI00359DE053